MHSPSIHKCPNTSPEHRSTRLSSLQTREANVDSSLLTCTKESGLDEVKANQARDEGLHVRDDVVVLLRHHILQGTHQRRQTEKNIRQHL